MSRRPRPVKRAYDGSGRQQRAEATRTATLDVAERLFLEDGYTATTVAAIAETAGVSEATIYKSYGGKAGLAREVCQRALRGTTDVPAEERSNALRSSNSADAVAEGWGRLAVEVSSRGAPLFLVLRNAAVTDPEAAALYAEFERQRLDRMHDNARFLHDAGLLRDGVSVQEARDVLWMSVAPEVYELLVLRRGWSRARFGRHVARTIRTITQ
jgi:AcrR family transcriptional regulator